MLLRNLSNRHGQLSKISSSFSLISFYSDYPQTKRRMNAPLQERRMIDRFSLWAKGGEGGNGCCSLRRTRNDRLGKPDGGNGGKGGDVILECSSDLWDFSSLQHHVNAKRGGNGISKNQIGTRGSDKIVQVPVGTVIHLVSGPIPSFIQHKSISSLNPWEIDRIEMEKNQIDRVQTEKNQFERTETEKNQLKRTEMEKTQIEMNEMDEIQESIAELTIPGQRMLIAKGGEGGLGNSSLPKVNGQSQRSESKSTLGQPGSESHLILELKSIADLGLVGFPNAGKSTLLSALSKARPLVGNYDFTTLRPNIGSLGFEDYFRVKIADIPGLIKGASENKGLGHAFLRHIERTSVLAYVLDLSSQKTKGKTGISPIGQLRDLVVELERYKKGMSEKASLIVGNKVDEEGCEEVLREVRERVGECVSVFGVCAVLGEGVCELKEGIRRLMDGRDLRYVDLSKIDLSD